MSKPDTTLIINPASIISLAKKGKCVWVEPWNRKSPAAFFLSWQFNLLMDWIGDGRIKMLKENGKA